MLAKNSGQPGVLGHVSDRAAAARAATRLSSLPLDDVSHSHGASPQSFPRSGRATRTDDDNRLRTLSPPVQQAHTGDKSLLRIAERLVNQGGEQGHDDYGLPPVDIEIPDDARELYRDVQAYHRELPALRRQERSIRWRAPFRRSGVAIPLLAGCLIAALVAVMLSAMFTQNRYFT